MGIRKSLEKLLSSAIVLPTLLLSSLPLLAEQGNHTTESISSPVVLSITERLNVRYDTYILGPGDRLQIELLDLPELSGEFTIGPDGTLYLPRLRALHVEGLTIEELRLFLTEQFRVYVIQPEIFITPARYRPVRVYVGGEVSRPGYYTIRGAELVQDLTFDNQQQRFEMRNSGAVRARPSSISSLEGQTSASGRLAQQIEQLPTPPCSTHSRQHVESHRSFN